VHISSFVFQVTLSQEDFSKVMQVLKENFAEGAVVEPRTPDTKGSEPKWNEPKKSLARPNTLEGRFIYFFVAEKNHIIGEHHNKEIYYPIKDAKISFSNCFPGRRGFKFVKVKVKGKVTL